MSGRVDWLTSKRVVCSVGNGTIYSLLSIGRGAGERLHSRDRRPRLETPPSLPQGEECLMVIYMNGSFYPKGCHRIGTDALVCPYCVALSLIKGTPLSKQRRRSVDTKRAFPCNEKGVSSHRRNTLFVCNQYCLLPSPFGEGTGERL